MLFMEGKEVVLEFDSKSTFFQLQYSTLIVPIKKKTKGTSFALWS